jgi:hypothetical protein
MQMKIALGIRELVGRGRSVFGFNQQFVWSNNNFNGRNMCFNSADESVVLRGIGIELWPSSWQTEARVLFVQIYLTSDKFSHFVLRSRVWLSRPRQSILTEGFHGFSLSLDSNSSAFLWKRYWSFSMCPISVTENRPSVWQLSICNLKLI